MNPPVAPLKSPENEPTPGDPSNAILPPVDAPHPINPANIYSTPDVRPHYETFDALPPETAGQPYEVPHSAEVQSAEENLFTDTLNRLRGSCLDVANAELAVQETAKELQASPTNPLDDQLTLQAAQINRSNALADYQQACNDANAAVRRNPELVGTIQRALEDLQGYVLSSQDATTDSDDLPKGRVPRALQESNDANHRVAEARANAHLAKQMAGDPDADPTVPSAKLPVPELSAPYRAAQKAGLTRNRLFNAGMRDTRFGLAPAKRLLDKMTPDANPFVPALNVDPDDTIHTKDKSVFERIPGIVGPRDRAAAEAHNTQLDSEIKQTKHEVNRAKINAAITAERQKTEEGVTTTVRSIDSAIDQAWNMPDEDADQMPAKLAEVSKQLSGLSHTIDTLSPLDPLRGRTTEIWAIQMTRIGQLAALSTPNSPNAPVLTPDGGVTTKTASGERVTTWDDGSFDVGHGRQDAAGNPWEPEAFNLDLQGGQDERQAIDSVAAELENTTAGNAADIHTKVIGAVAGWEATREPEDLVGALLTCTAADERLAQSDEEQVIHINSLIDQALDLQSAMKAGDKTAKDQYDSVEAALKKANETLDDTRLRHNKTLFWLGVLSAHSQTATRPGQATLRPDSSVQFAGANGERTIVDVDGRFTQYDQQGQVVAQFDEAGSDITP
ncbi:hypothetical protein CR970_01090 [Candidatus Saccharibacteria bacterium]|nr:MAG: hypothetical protein CR970_01090 [Candidatus Saccharibacteria bacterium]